MQGGEIPNVLQLELRAIAAAVAAAVVVVAIAPVANIVVVVGVVIVTVILVVNCSPLSLLSCHWRRRGRSRCRR